METPPMSATPLRHGVFLAPFHPVEDDPTLAIQRDLELMEWLDRLGFEEAWIGEHHSAGFEIISSPELFIAAAAERTKRIRFGTGVISLPYHNPLMVANRIVQLDHMTRGRIMLGVGPGLLISDAVMLGIDPNSQRERMVEGIDLILRLMDGQTVTEKTEWYDLVKASLHLLPYTQPRPEICVASSVTPSGGRVAGKYGLGMLCVAATNAAGFDVLGVNWKVAQDVAAEHGRTMDANALRLVGPMHIAETREQARANVQFGIHKWIDYFARVNPIAPRGTGTGDIVDNMINNAGAVIGTPDDAIARIESLYGKQGDFGAFLQLATNWADWESTKKSYELFARYVRPHFTGANKHRRASLDYVTEHGMDLAGQQRTAALKAFAEHEAAKQAKAAE
jgi:limonene 1,2-monooxygenase